MPSPNQRLFFVVVGDLRHERQVLDQTAGFALWRVCGGWVLSVLYHLLRHRSPSPNAPLGHSMPHCEGCSERGPETLRVFSNCDVMRVIMPMVAINDKRDSTVKVTSVKLLRPYPPLSPSTHQQ